MAASTFRGVAFPYQEGNQSFPAGAVDSDLIKQSIIQILLTERGERLMRSDFGSSVMSRVFENNDELLNSLLQAEVLAAVGKWEPRAIVTGVSSTRADSTITITVNFVIAASRQQDAVSLQLTTAK